MGIIDPTAPVVRKSRPRVFLEEGAALLLLGGIFFLLQKGGIPGGKVLLLRWFALAPWGIFLGAFLGWRMRGSASCLFLGGVFCLLALADGAVLFSPGKLPFLGERLWTAARYVEVFALLGIFLFVRYRLFLRRIFLAYGALLVLFFGGAFALPPLSFLEDPLSLPLFNEYCMAGLGGMACILGWVEQRGWSLRARFSFCGALLFLVFSHVFEAVHYGFFQGELPLPGLLGAACRGAFLGFLLRSVLLWGVLDPYERAEGARRRTARLLDRLPVFFWISDERNRRILWNQEDLPLNGRGDLDFSSGELWEERLHPGDRERCSELYRKARESREPLSLEYRHRKRSGGWATFLESSLPREDYPGFWGLSWDATPLREVHMRLREKEREWQTLANNLPDGIFRINQEGRILFVNVKGLHIFSLKSREEVEGKLFSQVSLPPAFSNLGALYFTPYFDEEKALPLAPVPLKCRSRYYDVRLIPEKDPRAAETKVLCIVQDVTGRFLEEYERDRLFNRMHRFATILETTTDFVCIFDDTGHVEYVNRAGLELLGWNGFWAPRHLRDFCSSREAEVLLKESAGLLKGDFVRYRERMLCRAKGDQVPVSQVLVPIFNEGQPTKFGIIARDIRERKRFEQELHYQKSLLQSLINALPLGIFLKDPAKEFRYTFWNDHMEAISGIPREEILDRKDSEEFQPEMALHLLEQDQEVLEENRVLVWEEVRLFRDGKEHLIRLMKLPLWDPQKDRGMRLILGVLEDITEAKRMEAQLSQAQKMEAVGRLAGGIAHDLNNMLQIIHGYAELLLQNVAGENKKIVFYGESIYNGCERAREFIEQLLVFHRKGVYRQEPVDLNALARDMTGMLEHVMPEGLELGFTETPDIPAVTADPGQIRQVVMNLCVNARDALGGKGRIRVFTSVFEGTLSPGTEEGKPGRYAVLGVEDNGPGMSRQVRERIFEPFYSTKAPGQGHGMGLSIVYAVAQRHGGDVRVESRPGGGSVFRVFFPLEVSPVPEPSFREERSRPEKPGRAPEEPKTVTFLFAEDEEEIRAFIREALLGWGYKVIMAKNGQEAVDLFKLLRDRIDGLLFDVMMPQKSGIDAYRAIAASLDLPVLFCSAYAESGIPEELKRRKNVLFLRKPFSLNVLKAKVEEMERLCFDAEETESGEGTTTL